MQRHISVAEESRGRRLGNPSSPGFFSRHPALLSPLNTTFLIPLPCLSPPPFLFPLCHTPHAWSGVEAKQFVRPSGECFQRRPPLFVQFTRWRRDRILILEMFCVLPRFLVGFLLRFCSSSFPSWSFLFLAFCNWKFFSARDVPVRFITYLIVEKSDPVEKEAGENSD